MRNRCLKPNSTAYKNYGGRGITIPEEWKQYSNFKKDMYNTYLTAGGDEARVTIDRIDNNQGYSVDNCKWSTYQEQANNRRSNKYITWEGKTKTLAEWGREYNIPSSRLRTRFYCYKWDINKCLNYPNHKKEAVVG